MPLRSGPPDPSRRADQPVELGDDSFLRRVGQEDRVHPAPGEIGAIGLREHRAAGDDRDPRVVAAGHERVHVTVELPRVGRDADDIGVLLHRNRHERRRRVERPEVDHLEAGPEEELAHRQGTDLVLVEAHHPDHDPAPTALRVRTALSHGPTLRARGRTGRRGGRSRRATRR